MIKRILMIAVVVIALVGVMVAGVGALSSPEHEGSLSQTYLTTAEPIWEILTDIEGIPDRRSEVKSLEILWYDENNYPAWKEYTDMGGYIVFETRERVHLEKIVIEMIDSSFGMTGTWIYEITGNQDDTTVTVSEVSRIDNVLTRGIMTITGRNGNIKRELNILEEELNLL